MGAIAALSEARDTNVVVFGNAYDHPSMGSEPPIRRRAKLPSGEAKASALTARRICLEIEKTVLNPLVTAGTANQFSEVRKSIFVRYVKLSMALAEVSTLQSSHPQEIEAEALSIFIRKIREETLFGWTEDMREEVVFCAETLERAYLIVSQFPGLPPASDIEKDRVLAADFTLASLWAQLHADCLLFAAYEGIKPASEVLQKMVSSMRTAGYAYSAATQGYSLRQPEDPPSDVTQIPWDAEDELLSESAMRFGLEAQRLA